jgi:predicted nucleic acid-binding protein
MDRLFVDTSAWFAYTNRADPDHHRVRQTLARFKGRLVTSNFILDEAVTLCHFRLGHPAAVTVGEVLQSDPSIDLVRLTPEDEQAAWTLFIARSDKQYSFTDCTSFALMRRLGLTKALTLDEDFKREGFVVVPEL